MEVVVVMSKKADMGRAGRKAGRTHLGILMKR